MLKLDGMAKCMKLIWKMYTLNLRLNHLSFYFYANKQNCRYVEYELHGYQMTAK